MTHISHIEHSLEMRGPPTETRAAHLAGRVQHAVRV